MDCFGSSACYSNSVWNLCNSIHNMLVRAQNKVAESLSSIEVYLKMRFDLVPNLVETVKEYAQHEKKALSEITKQRLMVQMANTTQETIQKSNTGLPVLKGVFALAEKYPDLKADKHFKQLEKSLKDIEESLVAARRFYNANINRYNNMIKVFPNNLLAKRFKCQTMEFFSIKLEEEVAPKIFGQTRSKNIASKTKKEA